MALYKYVGVLLFSWYHERTLSKYVSDESKLIVDFGKTFFFVGALIDCWCILVEIFAIVKVANISI